MGELVLARPDRRNALDYAAVGEILEALGTPKTIRAWDRCSCTAKDPPSARAGTSPSSTRVTATAFDFHRTGELWAELMLVIPRMTKPVVVAVHGHALAGGCGIVATADVAIAAESTQLGTSEIRIGLFPIVVYPSLVKAIGLGGPRARAHGRRISADEACRLGLVHRVVPDEALLERRVRSRRSAGLGSHALALGKWFIREVDELPLERATAFAKSIRGSFMTTPDFAEGLAAFTERRPPNFRDRS